jgi:hypothetical protein
MSAPASDTAPPAGAEPYQRDDGLWVFSRTEFVSARFDYKPGQHVTFGGPTQRGKTTLAFELLDHVATPDLPAYVAVSKPLDPVTTKRGRELGFRLVRDWPAPMKVNEMWDGKPRGYLVWPKFGDMDTDVQRCAQVTYNLIHDRYAAGVKNKRGILVMDDTMVKSKIMGLDREMTMILAMSGAMGIGQWTFVQKPTDSGQAAIWSYGASEHLFLLKDPDRRNQQRYDEIGGVDPRFVRDATNQLKPFQFLYLKRTEGFICVVDSK